MDMGYRMLQETSFDHAKSSAYPSPSSALDVDQPNIIDAGIQTGFKPATFKNQHHASFQTTLKNPVKLSGIGLHSGNQTQIVIAPAPENSGISFIRSDLTSGQRKINAHFNNVTRTDLCTGITNAEGAEIATIEHLMAAFAGLGIDNADIWVDANEIPIMDGSSEVFVDAIMDVGIETLGKNTRNLLYVHKMIAVGDHQKFARLLPATAGQTDLIIKLMIDYPAKAIGKQSLEFKVNAEGFICDISRARTFCMYQDIQYMQSKNLIKGGSLDNAIVVQDDKILNEDGLRFTDEFVRHKVLDCIGDLALAGRPLIGTLEASCTGHGLNNELLRRAFADDSVFGALAA